MICIKNVSKILHKPYMQVYRWLHNGCDESTAKKIRSAIKKSCKLDIPISRIMLSTAFYYPNLFSVLSNRSSTKLRNTMQGIVQQFSEN